MADCFTNQCYWTRLQTGGGFPRLQGEVEVDVAIIGGGIVGSIAARLLKDRGHQVALVEAKRCGHGVSGRSTAKVTVQHGLFLQRIEQDHGEAALQAYTQANQAGVSLIADLIAQHGLNCDFERADSFVYATTSEGVDALERERAAADRAGIPMKLLADAGLPYPTVAALRLADQAQFQPATFVAGLATTIDGDGSFVFEGSAAVDWTAQSVSTRHGVVRARQVIMATHLPLGQVGQFHAHTSPHMHAIMTVPVKAGIAPAGMYISADQPKRSLRRYLGPDGEMMMILAGPTFKHGDAAAEEDAFAELEGFARQHFGHAGGGYRWSNEDYAPRDGFPYVGWVGSSGKSLLVATGFDAWGLSNGAAAALVLADLCDGQDNPWAQHFNAARHSLTGVAKLASNAAHVAADLVSGHLYPVADAASAAEGDLVDISGRTAGLYRDGAGALRAVSAICTHMGCRLGWNPVDRTWDCSCHGSRFAADGEVVHGPATESLSSIELSDHEQESRR